MTTHKFEGKRMSLAEISRMVPCYSRSAIKAYLDKGGESISDFARLHFEAARNAELNRRNLRKEGRGLKSLKLINKTIKDTNK